MNGLCIFVLGFNWIAIGGIDDLLSLKFHEDWLEGGEKFLVNLGELYILRERVHLN